MRRIGAPVYGVAAHGTNLLLYAPRICLPGTNTTPLSPLLVVSGSWDLFYVFMFLLGTILTGVWFFRPLSLSDWETFGCEKATKFCTLPSLRVARHKLRQKKVQNYSTNSIAIRWCETLRGRVDKQIVLAGGSQVHDSVPLQTKPIPQFPPFLP